LKHNIIKINGKISALLLNYSRLSEGFVNSQVQQSARLPLDKKRNAACPDSITGD
jgi:hypothetical protein